MTVCSWRGFRFVSAAPCTWKFAWADTQLTRSIVESWARLALDRPLAGRQKIGGNFWTVERFTLDHGLIPWYLTAPHCWSTSTCSKQNQPSTTPTCGLLTDLTFLSKKFAWTKMWAGGAPPPPPGRFAPAPPPVGKSPKPRMSYPSAFIGNSHAFYSSTTAVAASQT